MEKVIEEWFGWNKEPGHDKVYVSRVIDRGNGTFIQQTGYGKRGSNLRLETSSPVGEYNARSNHAKTVKEKVANKYITVDPKSIGLEAQLIASTPATGNAPTKPSISTALTLEEVKQLFYDRNYIMTPFLKAKSRVIGRNTGGYYSYTVDSFGKTTSSDGLTTDMKAICKALGKDLSSGAYIDVHMVAAQSDSPWPFNGIVLEDVGGLYSNRSYEERVLVLRLLAKKSNVSATSLPLAFNATEKITMFKNARKSGFNEVAFRKRDEIYSFDEPKYLTYSFPVVGTL